MYKTDDNFRALAKALYNTRAKFPRPVVFPLAYAFIHKRGREPYWKMFRM